MQKNNKKSMIQFNYKKIFDNNHMAIAKAISLIENKHSDLQSLHELIYSKSYNALRIGITGPPGSGKSTIVDKLIEKYQLEKKSIGVIAIDPSSPFNGGALLGDRVRMGKFIDNENVFIRSMGNKGSLGGLAEMSQEAGDVLAASGKDIVIFETVGVGQAEHDIVNVADFTIVVLVPESGDEVQLMKAGVIEIADLFVINKSDRLGSKRLTRLLSNSLHNSIRENQSEPAIINTTATTGEGIPELFNKVNKEIKSFEKLDIINNRRLHRYKNRIKSLVSEKLESQFWIDSRKEFLDEISNSIKSIKTSPRVMMETIIKNFKE